MNNDITTRTKQARQQEVGGGLQRTLDLIGITATRSTTWRPMPTVRNTLLVLHIVSGIGWIGVDFALLALLYTMRTTDDPALVVSGFNATRMIVPLAVPPLSLTILATGLVLGMGTKWGIIRYWWVFVKLVLSLLMTFLVFRTLVPGANAMPILTTSPLSADAVRASLGDSLTLLMFPPVVSCLMLAVATVLSVFKPWQRTPWTRNTGAALVNKHEKE